MKLIWKVTASHTSVTKQIDILQLIRTTSLDEPRHLASIDPLLIARSYNSSTTSPQNLVASKFIICLVGLTAHLAMPLSFQKLMIPLIKKIR